MRLVSKSVYCEALDNISSLIEHWFCAGTSSLSCHINLTPCILLSAKSTLQYLPDIHEHLQWDIKSGLAEVVSGHTSLIIPPDVIFMFGSCTGRGEKGYFPKCLLLISAAEKSRLWRECGVTCQSKPTETWWMSHCCSSGDQLAVHWNSSDIGTWLTAHRWAFFFRLITLSSRTRQSHSHAPWLLWLLLVFILIGIEKS